MPTDFRQYLGESMLTKALADIERADFSACAMSGSGIDMKNIYLVLVADVAARAMDRQEDDKKAQVTPPAPAGWFVQTLDRCDKKPARTYSAILMLAGVAISLVVTLGNVAIGMVHGFRTGKLIEQTYVAAPRLADAVTTNNNVRATP